MIQTIEAGSEVNIRVYAYRVDVTPRTLADPGGGIELRIIQPDGTVTLTLSSMPKLTTGVYQYQHQTAVDDPIGVWRLQVQVTDQDVWLTVPMVGFKVIDPT
jgi:uncharacterized protein YfaS (alpha-2-macroglobulin family)